MILGWDSRAIVQCHQNVVAGLRFHGFPALGPGDWVATQRDRNLIRCPFGFRVRLDSLMERGLFVRDPRQIHHFHGPNALCAWRETAPFTSMHIITFTNGIAEIHFDLCNPAGGLVPMVGHGLECLFPGPTNPFRVAKGLKRRGVDVVMVEEA